MLLLLLLFLIHHLGYLASSVTMVTSRLMHSRLVTFEGRAAAAERKKERSGSCIIQIFCPSPFFSSKLLSAAFKVQYVRTAPLAYLYSTQIGGSISQTNCSLLLTVGFTSGAKRSDKVIIK